MEPHLVIFTNNVALSQMILSGENEETTEVPGETLVKDLIAAYHVLGLEYPEICRALLCFFISRHFNGRPDTHGPAKNRPTHYKTFISSPYLIYCR